MRYLTAYRFSVNKFNRMCAAGLFEDEKVELLNGLMTRMTSGPGHDYAVALLSQILEKLLPADRWSVREEKPVELGRFWRPQPDVAVVRGTHRDFAARTPCQSDIALIIEVSDSTYAKDTRIKLRQYERSGIAVYWVVDLSRRRVEVREMGGRGLAVPVYHHEDDDIRVVLDGKDYGRVPVGDLLP